jgi:predicted porin
MHLKMDGLGVRLAYTDTKGIGADGLYGFGGINDAEVKATQWYGEMTYVQGKTTIGASYGEGQQDETTTPVGAALAVTNKLGMVFVHHKVTPAFTVVGELQDYRSDAQAAYNAYIVGAQFDF